MYHSLIINVGDNYIDTWDDWKLIPSSRPVIAPPIERTKFVPVPGRDGALDYSRTPANRPTYDDRTGKLSSTSKTTMLAGTGRPRTRPSARP